MVTFEIPKKMNGTQLIEELAAEGISCGIPLIQDGLLWLDIDEAQAVKAKKIVSNHIGKDRIPTIEEKLKTFGIDLEELKAILKV